MKTAPIVRYRNQFGCTETYIAPASLTCCEIRWLLPAGAEIIAIFCFLPQHERTSPMTNLNLSEMTPEQLEEINRPFLFKMAARQELTPGEQALHLAILAEADRQLTALREADRRERDEGDHSRTGANRVLAEMSWCLDSFCTAMLSVPSNRCIPEMEGSPRVGIVSYPSIRIVNSVVLPRCH